MELLYVFMKTVRDDDFNLKFNFSSQYEVKYDENSKLINIEEKEKSYPKNLFGKNIKNITTIVGRNGVGKSTLLALLGLQKIDRRFELKPAKWFAIYKLEKDLFGIEGYDTSFIENNAPLKVSDDYFFYFKIDKIQNEFQHFLHEKNISKIRSKIIFLHFPEMRHRKPNYNGDQNLSFERDYLYVKDKWIYKYIVEKHYDIDKKISNQKIEIRLPRSFAQNNVNDYDSIKLYRDFDGFYSEDKYSLYTKDKGINIPNTKQLFIIYMLESIINEIILKSIENTIPDSIDATIDTTIYNRFLVLNLNPYSDKLKNYETIKTFLIEKIKISLEISEDVHGLKTELNYETIIEYIEKFPESYFHNQDSGLAISVGLDLYNENIFKLLSEFDKIYISLPLHVRFPEKSDGELAIIKKLSSLSGAINENIKIGKENFIILLDEIDRHLHPEWSRCFLSMLLETLNSHPKKIQFQVLTTTHSPYIISDLPRNNILRIEKNNKNELFVSHSDYGFGSNIYDIINDSFFLKSPIGEFALRKINNAHSFIRNINPNTKIDPIRINEIQEIIEMIDDPFIKKTLTEALYEKLRIQQDRYQEIAFLEARLAEIKKGAIL